ncbi:hypothetical protein HME01_11010 [Vreelandella aquamarina]|nr:hypothetical protein HME01_11010 [Halomonas meridiana]
MAAVCSCSAATSAAMSIGSFITGTSITTVNYLNHGQTIRISTTPQRLILSEQQQQATLAG